MYLLSSWEQMLWEVTGGVTSGSVATEELCHRWGIRILLGRKNMIRTSFPYFGVKLSCVCLMSAYRKKLPKVTQR